MNRLQVSGTRGESSIPKKLPALAMALLIPAALSGCDLSVTNPGPVDDEFLAEAAAHEGMVNGMGRALSDAVNWIALTAGAVSREVVGSGNLIAFGVNLNHRAGKLLPSEIDDHWNRAQRARWTAENGAERIRESLGGEFTSSPLGARALLYAGYANRLLGENMCEAVIDGGPRQPRSEYFERALGHFDEALAVAVAADESTLATAARAGRASVKLWLGDWAGAVADAEAVPAGFRYDARMTTNNVDEYNRLVWAVSSQPFRTISVVDTYYADYYTDTGDARVAWDRVEAFPYGDSGDPPVPFYRQRKYVQRDDGIPLSKSEEMVLIVAESRLRDGDWPGAMALMNGVRAEAGVEPWSAASAEEAWQHLKRERGIVLWLEGRRLGDLARWRAEGAPGANPDDFGQDPCFPIAQGELDTNPNL